MQVHRILWLSQLLIAALGLTALLVFLIPARTVTVQASVAQINRFAQCRASFGAPSFVGDVEKKPANNSTIAEPKWVNVSSTNDHSSADVFSAPVLEFEMPAPKIRGVTMFVLVLIWLAALVEIAVEVLSRWLRERCDKESLDWSKHRLSFRCILFYAIMQVLCWTYVIFALHSIEHTARANIKTTVQAQLAANFVHHQQSLDSSTIALNANKIPDVTVIFSSGIFEFFSRGQVPDGWSVHRWMGVIMFLLKVIDLIRTIRNKDTAIHGSRATSTLPSRNTRPTKTLPCKPLTAAPRPLVFPPAANTTGGPSKSVPPSYGPSAAVAATTTPAFTIEKTIDNKKKTTAVAKPKQ